MATITVSSIVIPQWKYGGTTAILRLFLDRGFVASSGIPLQSSAPGSGQFYKDVAVTIVGTDATIAATTLDSTTDGLDIQTARYSAYFYTTSGARLKSYDQFSSFIVGPTPTTVSWSDIRTFNFNLVPNSDTNAYTKAQADSRFALIGVVSGMADPGGNGLMVRTALNVSTARTLTDGVGITWTNGSGTAGNPSAAWNPTTFVANVALWDASQATRTLTANLSGATDPVITFADGVVNISTGTLQVGGAALALAAMTITGASGVSGGGSLAANRTLTLDQAFSPTWTGVHVFTPAARTSGVAPFLTINAPTDTTLTAATEAIGVSFVGATRQHANGAIATQREYVFAKPTYSFVSGSNTVTSAATLAVTGAPVAGGFATLTNTYALWVQGDQSRFDGVVSQLTAGAVDPLTGPNLVGNQIVKFGTAASGTFSASGDYRQLQSYVINAGTANTVAGTFGTRMDGAGQGWGLNPYAYANVSGATGVAIETNFGVLTSGGAAYGEVFVVVGNFASTAFVQFQSGASGIAATNGIVFLKGGAGLDPVSGSAITFSGGPQMAIGVDFSGGSFTTAVYKLANNSFPVALNASSVAKIVGGMGSDNFMLFQSGDVNGGVRFLNSANTLNLFRVRDGGALVSVWFAAAQITANQNNYNPDAASGANGKDAYYQSWFSDASRDVTGLTFQQAQVDGQMHVIWNAGAQNIVIKHENASSTAANRFLCSTFADITLAGGQAADIVYRSTNARWLVFKRN